VGVAEVDAAGRHLARGYLRRRLCRWIGQFDSVPRHVLSRVLQWVMIPEFTRFREVLLVRCASQLPPGLHRGGNLVGLALTNEVRDGGRCHHHFGRDRPAAA
jgi:hypothetical protein